MSELVPQGMDLTTGQPRIAQVGDVLWLSGGTDSSLIQTSGALPTTTFTSGTGKQISTTRDVNLWVPITYSSTISVAATCKVEISPDNVTYSTLSTESVPLGLVFVGIVMSLQLVVYKGFYVRLTVANASIGTATYW